MDFAILAVGMAAGAAIFLALKIPAPSGASVAAAVPAIPAVSAGPVVANPAVPDTPNTPDAPGHALADDPASILPRLLPQSGAPDVAAPAAKALSLVPPPDKPDQPWLRFAAAAPDVAGRPVIAIIIDDMGLDRKQSERAVMLPAPLTLSYMTYARDLAGQTGRARARGHELMVHLPMEPRDRREDPGPRALLSRLSGAELAARLDWSLGRFGSYVGVNNHMGSRLTENRRAMALVMARLKAGGLLFVDSRTSIRSVAMAAARAARVPNAVRDIFLDNDARPAVIRRQLDAVERMARRRGYAIAIGHPREATMDVLGRWISEAAARGFVFVPISFIVRGARSFG
jgi:uncharacterized protein